MKTLSQLIILSFIISGFSCSPTLSDLKKFAPVESYPQDTFLDTVSVKRALIIVAHDDDDCIMAGTLSKLHSNGWEIEQFSFTRHLQEEGLSGHPSEIFSEGNFTLVPEKEYRYPQYYSDKEYMPLPREKFDSVFKKDLITRNLIKLVNDFKPSVIFTLDNEIGGYGHPDHVFLSQLVLDLTRADSIHPERIYQSVFTDHMEKEIIEIWLNERLKKWGYPNMYLMAKELYKIPGMPAPDVEINITKYAAAKMAYLRGYREDVRKNIRKFVPYYENFKPEEYFGIFDREFFKVQVIKD